MVALMLPVLLGLGIWQLARAQEKDALLDALARHATLPPLELQALPLPDARPDLHFRRVRLRPDCPAQAGIARAGRSRDDTPGYVLLLRCRAGGTLLLVSAGWQRRPNPATAPALAGRTLEGLLVPAGREAPWLLVPREGLFGLAPSAPPGPETIPNRHRAYALQWFSFAGILLAVYGLWVRRWREPLETPAPEA